MARRELLKEQGLFSLEESKGWGSNCSLKLRRGGGSLNEDGARLFSEVRREGQEAMATSCDERNWDKA